MIEISNKDAQNLALRLIEGSSERGKVDFKRDIALDTPAGKIEFCKDLSAIANSDDERLDGYGLIIIGATSGRLLGGVKAWETGKEDNFSASLTDIAKNYIAPVPLFSFAAFNDPSAGNWGVILIPPSSNQPHLLIRELSGNPAKHEWFVRLNDTTERAGVLDYARVLQGATHRVAKPLEAEMHRLALRVERLEEEGVVPAGLLNALGRSVSNGESDRAIEESSQATSGLLTLLRRELSTPQSRAEELLAEEALQVRAIMLEERPENPQVFATRTGPELLKPIEYMEARTRTFAEAIAVIARQDSTFRYSSAVLEAIDIIAEQPELSGAHWQHAQELRLYPLLLSLYSLAMVCAARDDGRLLRKVLDREFRIERRERVMPLIWAIRASRSAGELFNGAASQRYFEPIAQRLLSVVPLWCAPMMPGKDGKRAFFQAEFAFALEHERLNTAFHGAGMPLPGAFLYGNGGEAAVTSMLNRKSQFLQHLFGKDLEHRLSTFDENIGQLVEPGAFRRGFSQKTADVWSGAEKAG
jgi:hypothetical protein